MVIVMVIEIGRYRLVPHDGLNWRVHVYKAIDRGKRKGENDWMPVERYFGSVRLALEWIADREARKGKRVKSVREAIAAFDGIADRLSSQVKEVS